MKKSHEYDSPVLSKLVSVVTVIAVCICSVCCVVTASKVSEIATGGTVVSTGNTPSADSQTPNASTPDAQTPSASTPGSDDSNSQTPGTDDSNSSETPNTETPGTDTPAGPTNEEILAKYTEVMNGLKDGIATYDKKEFQTLADDYDLGTVGNLVLPIAQGLMTDESEAELQKRDDKEQIPIVRNDKGCLLTDASAIKSASMTESGGKTTIVITLNDEKGSYPAEDGAASCGSIVGSMFNPLDQEEIDEIVAEFSAVVDVAKFELTCKDCTATLVFDTATGEVESLNQIMNYYIDVEAKAMGLLTVAGYATLINNMTINNVVYK